MELKPRSRILLIEPPFYRFFGYERWHYPITLTLLATLLKEQGHEVRVYDADQPSGDCRSLSRSEVRKSYHRYEEALANHHHPIWREVMETVSGFTPDVVGLTSISAKIDSADRIAGMVKREFGPRVTTVLGGAHVQGMRAMDPCHSFGDAYDRIVLRIPNLINRTPDKKLILNCERYSPANLSSILTSTGCPNSCTFCCHSFERNLEYKEYPFLRQEIEELRRDFPGSAVVDILDDCAFSNSRHFRRVIGLLHDNGLSFTAGARIMALTREKIASFAEKGGKRIFVGVESGSQRVLDRTRKRLKINDVVERTKWLNEAGIPWSAFFIVGFPFETLDDLKMTEELVHRIRPTFVSLNRFTPYPGTELYREFFSGSALRFRDLFQLNGKSCVTLSDESEALIDGMFRDFDLYNRGNLPQQTTMPVVRRLPAPSPRGGIAT